MQFNKYTHTHKGISLNRRKSQALIIVDEVRPEHLKEEQRTTMDDTGLTVVLLGMRVSASRLSHLLRIVPLSITCEDVADYDALEEWALAGEDSIAYDRSFA